MPNLVIVNKLTNLSKVVKVNILLLTMLLIAATMTVSFASGGSNTCGARVALVLDRSSSIGVDQFSGGRAQSIRNIDAIKVGANNLIDALKGQDSYTDLYAFASVAQRINTHPDWYPINTQDNTNLQKWVVGSTKFKQGATSGSENAYDDQMQAGSEGLTNWEHALWLISDSHLTHKRALPTHVVFFTDGNPTTNIENTIKAIAAGGSYSAAGLPNEDGTHAPDIDRAAFRALWFHTQGVKIIPVAVGAEGIVNMSNLQKLAGAGNPVYRANSYDQLSAQFLAAAANICKPATTPGAVVVHATDEAGNLLPTSVTTTTSGAVASSPNSGKAQTTAAAGSSNPWSARWNVETTGNWGASIVAQTPAGYEPVSDRCRRDNWNGAGAADLPQANGSGSNATRVDVTPLANGGTIYCQFIFKKKFVPQDGIQLTKTVNPTKAKRGEAVTYTFVVKNTGNTKLTNIKVTDPMLGGLVGTIAELAPGASSAPINKPYTIPSNATGTIKNVAVAEGTPIGEDGKPRPNVKDDDTALVEVELRAGQKIEKTVTPSVAGVGQEVTYTIAVTNTGENTLENVVVTDVTLNQEITVKGPIAPGATGTAHIKYTIKSGDFKDGKFTNVACIKGTQTCDDAKVTEPKVQLTKSGPAVARPGQKVTFTFVVENTGSTDLTDHVIVDKTLSELTGKNVEIKVPGTLKPGEKSELVKYDFTIPASFKENVFKNVAVVTSTPIDPDTKEKVPGSKVTDEDDHSIALIRWEATKTADKKSTVPGDTVTYTITVKNTGGVALTNLEVSDPTIGYPENGKPEVIDVLAPGQSKSFTAKYVIPKDIEGNTFKNVALVCLPIEGQDDDCQEPVAVVDIARISITKTASKERALPGDTVTYTFVVKNTGGVTIEPTEVYDSILGVIGKPGTLAPGESATLTKDYVVPADTQDGAEITNIATVCAPVPGADADEDLKETDCETTCPTDSLATLCDQDEHTLVVDIPSITVVKSANTESAAEGDTVTYKFVITNTSKVTLYNVEVVDNVLGNVGVLEKLDPGQSAEKLVDYVVPAGSAAIGTIRNVVTACFETPVWEDNCATDDHELTVVAVGGEAVERPTLPYTGASSTLLAAISAVLLAAGTALFLGARRRKEIA